MNKASSAIPRLTLKAAAVIAAAGLRPALAAVFLAAAAAAAQAQVNVLTYHYNNQRTGWNSDETVLTPSTVTGLQLEATVTLDDQSDAQPLVYNGQVYVVTENNSVYEINAATGSVTAHVNLGSPVTTVPPNGCNSGHVGITSTPVIDEGTNTLYVMAYTDIDGSPAFQLHALDTATLADLSDSPVTVTASGTLTNGKPYAFDASVTRQRAALMLSVDGDIYAGFASFCDVIGTNTARGWLMGWQAGSLTPIGTHLNNRDPQTSSNDYFLTSIWMSGAGIAEDASANLYFATGNSNPNALVSYNQKYNLSQSVIELSSDLNTVESFFTPSGVYGVIDLDKNDLDMSGGGVLLTPDGYVVAAGKAGLMYLLNQGNLGGRAPDYVARRTIGFCLCTESYYLGSDGQGRIVSSGGNQRIQVWLEPSFQFESQSPVLNGGAGFFTSVSSYGSENALIWAVDRAASSSTELTLYAYDPAAKKIVFEEAAGTWPASNDAHNNTVPVVANGQVFVASYKQLTIWGLSSPAAAVSLAHPAFANPVQLQPGEHDILGTITAMTGKGITIKKRDGTVATVDMAGASTPPLTVGEGVRVVGTGTKTVLHAKWVARAQAGPKVWPPDR
jgi:hypothetical protein